MLIFFSLFQKKKNSFSPATSPSTASNSDSSSNDSPSSTPPRPKQQQRELLPPSPSTEGKSGSSSKSKSRSDESATLEDETGLVRLILHNDSAGCTQCPGPQVRLHPDDLARPRRNTLVEEAVAVVTMIAFFG